MGIKAPYPPKGPYDSKPPGTIRYGTHEVAFPCFPKGPSIIMVCTYRVFWGLSIYHNDTWTLWVSCCETRLQLITHDSCVNIRFGHIELSPFGRRCA